MRNLMIGDWLQHANGKYYQVTRIDGLSDGNIHFACGTPHLWEYNNRFEPIPITKEVLQKNEFIIKKKFAQIGNFGDSPLILWYFEYDPILKDFKHELEIHQNDTGRVHIHIPCEYVHELQHAFRLCGIEKEIQL